MITLDSLHIGKQHSADEWIRKAKSNIKQFYVGLKNLGGGLNCDLVGFIFSQEADNLSCTG